MLVFNNYFIIILIQYCEKNNNFIPVGFETREEEVDGNKQYTKQIVAEKVTFLSSRSNETKNKDDVERD